VCVCSERGIYACRVVRVSCEVSSVVHVNIIKGEFTDLFVFREG